MYPAAPVRPQGVLEGDVSPWRPLGDLWPRGHDRAGVVTLKRLSAEQTGMDGPPPGFLVLTEGPNPCARSTVRANSS